MDDDDSGCKGSDYFFCMHCVRVMQWCCYIGISIYTLQMIYMVEMLYDNWSGCMIVRRCILASYRVMHCTWPYISCLLGAEPTGKVRTTSLFISVYHFCAPCLNRSTDLDAIWQVHLWGAMTHCVKWCPWPPSEAEIRGSNHHPKHAIASDLR